MNTRVEKWNGYEIRFVKLYDGEWWAILKDICDALGLRTDAVAHRVGDEYLERVSIEVFDPISNVVKSRGRGEQLTRQMLVINEFGIYEALFASRKLEARKFRHWTATVMKRLRQDVGLRSYEVLRMTDPDVHEEIDYILDSIYYDEERKMLMRSVTVQGGDVEQVPFFD